ncbi:MAG: S41 family peptidase [Phycisphaerales bacterium]
MRVSIARIATLSACAWLGAATAVAQTAPTQEKLTGAEWADSVWAAAMHGEVDRALTLIDRLSDEGVGQPAAALQDALASRNLHIAEAEAKRAERIAEAKEEMAEHFNDGELADALGVAVEIHTLSRDPEKVLADPIVSQIVTKAATDAAASEQNGEWFDAHELYYRLNLLYEESGRFRDDVQRIGRRLAMLRLYAPERLHEMRNEQRLKHDLDELPPYNALGDDWRERLDGVNQTMVIRALNRAEAAHVDGADMARMLIAGLDAVKTMATTSDLKVTFDGLAKDQTRAEFIAQIDDVRSRLEQRVGRAGYFDLTQTLSQVLKDNTRTVNLPEEAILHEFGNGALSVLDDFTAIIWPDEIRQFQRSTEGRFTGVGIQIVLDDAQQLQVVTPLEGTPAQRAGIRPGDFIRAVDGVSTLGISTTQAVEKITGTKGTPVTLTIERPGVEDPFDVTIFRDIIPLYSVKGWRRAGAKETEWDWFIDRENGVGYVRLTQFSEDTTRELRRAIGQMRQQGLEGLILDLRFNPGGLLSEAVGVANVFVERGVIVSQHDAAGVEREAQHARSGFVMLDDMPIVVLVNEGTASASEIVAGCLQDYDRALVVGARSYGKGSVQNVYDIARGEAALKLTTQYYRLPAGRLIHRRVGDHIWGVQPDVTVDMLPQQISDALLLRQDADVLPIDEAGEIIENPDEERPEPEQLLSKGIDTQLETALLLIRSQIVGRNAGPAAVMLEPAMPAGS